MVVNKPKFTQINLENAKELNSSKKSPDIKKKNPLTDKVIVKHLVMDYLEFRKMLFFTMCFWMLIGFFYLIWPILLRSSLFSQSATVVLVYNNGGGKMIKWPAPPPHKELAAVARYVMHTSEWGSLSTNSTHEGIEGYPFVNVFSVSDGPIGNSTGVPYFYFTPLELSVKDMEVNNKVSFTVSEAQSDYCSQKGFDPEDPRCAHIILTGVMTKIKNGTHEEEFARRSLFSRHQEMKYWPAEHNWFFAKLDIMHIYVLDYFGGVGVVSLDEYYATNPFNDEGNLALL